MKALVMQRVTCCGMMWEEQRMCSARRMTLVYRRKKCVVLRSEMGLLKMCQLVLMDHVCEER